MDNITILTALGKSLGLTLALEVGFFFILFYLMKISLSIRTGNGTNFVSNFLFKAPWNKKDILLVILVNTLTNPIVVLIYWILYYNTNWSTILIIVPLEIFAVITEGFIYKRKSECINRPFLFSLAVNAFSYTTGLIIFALI